MDLLGTEVVDRLAKVYWRLHDLDKVRLAGTRARSDEE